MSDSKPAQRKAEVERKTRETEVRISLNLDGSGIYEVSTRIPFLDHMLESFAKHGLFDLVLDAKGDLEVDAHHTVEDIGIALGEAVRQAVGNAEGIVRFGTFVVPMAEARAEVSVDLSNRPFLVYRVPMENPWIGSFDASLVEDFCIAFAQAAGLDLHIELRYGKSPHHCVEAVFKAMARALSIAVARDPRVRGVPSVKGAL